jgi:peptidoglycan hydrolase CwlO-like protein
MKLRCINLCTSFLLVISSTSCNQSEQKIRSAEKMIENAESNTAEMPKTEIDELDNKMKELQNSLDENRADFTDDQVKEIGKLQGRYTAVLLKRGIKNFKQSVKDFGNQMEGFIEGVTDSTN